MTEKRQAAAANEDVAEERDDVQNRTIQEPEQAPTMEFNEGETPPGMLPSHEATEEITLALEQAEARARDFSDKVLRAQADLENMRRRSERELVAAHRYAQEGFAKELVNVRDSLEMGLEAARTTVDIEKLREGMDLTLRMLTSVFEKFGVKEVAPIKQKFDPVYHQAMSVQESTEFDPNTVLAVFQKGYLLHDRLLRPALVQVSKAASKPPTDASES
jgi:molecular chaperone GrpE